MTRHYERPMPKAVTVRQWIEEEEREGERAVGVSLLLSFSAASIGTFLHRTGDRRLMMLVVR